MILMNTLNISQRVMIKSQFVKGVLKVIWIGTVRILHIQSIISTLQIQWLKLYTLKPAQRCTFFKILEHRTHDLVFERLKRIYKQSFIYCHSSWKVRRLNKERGGISKDQASAWPDQSSSHRCTKG